MIRSAELDIEKLLSPVSAERPAGEPLRYEGTYDRIREARREDDPDLPQGHWKTELRKAQWKLVESICVEALETRSKDLQVAAWLTEAWLNVYGFAGAEKGLELMRGLCESFWDDLYPPIENGDLEFRMAPLAWVNEKLSVSIKKLPITAPDAPGEKPWSWADWEKASLRDQAAQRAGEPRPQPGAPSAMADFQRSALLTPSADLRATLQDVRATIEAGARLESLVDAKAGKTAPGLLRLTGAAETIAALIESLLAHRADEMAPEDNNGGSHAASAGVFDEEVDEPARLPVPGRIRDRADAYYLLAEAADFLARTEPHSPTPYLIRRAIAWGSMSLDELLPELVRNGGELAEIFRLLQIRPNPGGNP